ncbi:MAG: ABC transporter permease, partial [Cyclobacteriaceae bacterium]
MLRINFLLGFRYLLKRKTYAIVNTLGLSIGLTSCILIFLFINNQFSFDKSMVDADRVYRMKELKTIAGDKKPSAAVPYSFAKILMRDYPEVENATVFAGPFEQQVAISTIEGTKAHFLEEGVLLADSIFFQVLGFKFIRGVPETALNTPESLVLTKSTAKKYFGDLDPLGKTISLGRRNCVVTGVCEDPPTNSHFKFSLLLSSLSFKWLSHDQFNLNKAYCYLKLKPYAEAKRLESKFPEMVRTYVGAEIARINKVSWEDYVAGGNDYQYSIQPITSVHLDTEVSNGMRAGGNPTTLNVLIGIAILIFVIACINFMNLSTATSMERAREVGIRKVLGSLKSQLILQFLIESLLLTISGVVCAIVITYLMLPLFSKFVENHLFLEWSLNSISVVILVILFVTIISGLYPAFVLSAYKPSLILKGTFSNQPKGKLIKNGMIIFQFWISIVLITSTIVIYKQVDFMNTKDLGFDKDQLLVVEGLFNMNPNYAKPFLAEIRNHSKVQEATGSLWVQGFQHTWSDEYKSTERADVVSINRVIIGDRVGEILNYKLVEGGFFSDQTHDSLSVILNLSAVKAMGLENPIGKKIALVNHDKGTIDYVYFVIKGVVEDFHYRSLRNEIE